jgi:hypothetical protein
METCGYDQPQRLFDGKAVSVKWAWRVGVRRHHSASVFDGWSQRPYRIG